MTAEKEIAKSSKYKFIYVQECNMIEIQMNSKNNLNICRYLNMCMFNV